MAWLKKLLITCVAIVAVFVAVGFILPSNYQVQREITINASADKIYPNIVNLKSWPQWAVWFMRDPNMAVSFSGPDRAIGMQTSWESESQGNGEMEIVSLKHNREIIYHLHFPDYEMSSTGVIKLTDTDQGTLVTWSDSGDLGMNPVNRYMSLMIDGMIGPDFELGLENLKTVVENRS